MHDKPEVSVIIVTWNSADEISHCIDSIVRNSEGIRTEIIVVDNASSDDTVEILRSLAAKHSQLKLIINKTNTGFTKGCNSGIEASSGDSVLLLNPDTVVTQGALKKLFDRLFSEDKLGGVAPQLLNKDNTVQISCRTFPEYPDMFYELSLLSSILPESKIFSRWKMNYFDHRSERFVDQPMAAALMVKRKVLDLIGNFDERFFMFFNDVDLCKKIHDNGYKILFYPEAKIYHDKGVSIYKDRARMIKAWNTDCVAYFKKYHDNFLLHGWLNPSLKITGYLRIFIHKLKK